MSGTKQTRVSRKQAENTDLRKCTKCNSFKQPDDFIRVITIGNVKTTQMISTCIKCRTEYILKKEKESGKKQCMMCKKYLPLEEYTKPHDENLLFPSCKLCRVEWLKQQGLYEEPIILSQEIVN
jgi:predicted RNA-binding protein YlxR (DUF448 family)